MLRWAKLCCDYPSLELDIDWFLLLMALIDFYPFEFNNHNSPVVCAHVQFACFAHVELACNYVEMSGFSKARDWEGARRVE